jgi:hypothetical protein
MSSIDQKAEALGKITNYLLGLPGIIKEISILFNGDKRTGEQTPKSELTVQETKVSCDPKTGSSDTNDAARISSNTQHS